MKLYICPSNYPSGDRHHLGDVTCYSKSLDMGKTMPKADGVHRATVDRKALPAKWPTHQNSPEFWEQLGRTIATFGLLEEVLAKAIFAFTGTRQYAPDEIQAAFDAWLPKLQKALSDTLKPLADDYGKAVKEHPERTADGIEDLVSDIKELADVRNVICHGSWRRPDAAGKSLPLFVDKKGSKNDRHFDVSDLLLVQRQVVEIIATVIDTVTHMGFQFPGGAGPGKRPWSDS